MSNDNFKWTDELVCEYADVFRKHSESTLQEFKQSKSSLPSTAKEETQQGKDWLTADGVKASELTRVWFVIDTSWLMGSAATPEVPFMGYDEYKVKYFSTERLAQSYLDFNKSKPPKTQAPTELPPTQPIPVEKQYAGLANSEWSKREFKFTQQPKTERITVNMGTLDTGGQRGRPHQYDFVTSYPMAKDQLSKIKEAIEAILNNVEYHSVPGFMFSHNKGYTQQQMDEEVEKAFAAGRERIGGAWNEQIKNWTYPTVANYKNPMNDFSDKQSLNK